ncbi:hypothetical protein AA313_de0203600 [Arthrobotrys entomopaga]|nr:hypothetical protein AA313_de0203600 [Arthrobotrys entomopaga]
MQIEGRVVFFYGGLRDIRTKLHPVLYLPAFLLGILKTVEHSPRCIEESSQGEKFTDLQLEFAVSRVVADIFTVYLLTSLLVLQTPTWVQVILCGSLVVTTTVCYCVYLGLRPTSTNSGDNHYSLLYQPNTDDMELEEYSSKHSLRDRIFILPGNTLRGSISSFIYKLWIFLFGLVCTKILLEDSWQRAGKGNIVSNWLSVPSHGAARGFDIVVSHYKEDFESLGAFIDGLRSISKINDLKPNLIIYTKNNQSDIYKIKGIMGASEVIVLPNEGRETATYFYHIMQRWEDLANHTLFIQAGPHNVDRVIDRLRSYFEPSRTGILDLGFRDLRLCNCLDCKDEFGWVDEARIIPDLMAEAHHVKCDKDTKVSISYKGQFVVSARRIRSVKKSIYESLNSKLVGDNRILLGGEEDRLDAPILGYTLERAWNVLFQCADQTGVRDICPSLTLNSASFHADLRKPRPEDCGCVDS